MRWAALLGLVLFASGCTLLPRDDGSGGLGLPDPTPQSPAPVGPPLVFGGAVLDARDGAPLNATVRVDLAQVQPCGRQSVGWSSWEAAAPEGRWGPIEVPRPRSDDVAFFVHASAAGYAENATFIGPTQARGDIGNMTVLLHPEADISGTAPPGTIVALDAPTFPRVTVANASGAFRFPHARSAPAVLVAATDVPYRQLAAAPADVSVPASSARGWLLEGSVKGATGAPLAADVVAWNGTVLVSAARASEAGAFALPLAPEPISLRLEARTADGRFGGVRSVELAGPPALRETMLATALCG
ncbi:MAG TPA: hypothetical protein VM370_04860 [Candidatus Thermoplasmatota archaeon]|nr:hypothetical protein [Candidatus Thermoplasmatota archaeon]